ncbi:MULTISPECIES: L-lactate permease [Rubrivivax]|uniref:L-lactate permease n=1 Tax=Rubrivivax benzoatilyticus TaxID=316997 RepID=A0ABX0HXW0_9BURK|nr:MULTISPECIES: L-lactate permease [Rubrivivax]MCD0417577.1 L-lactate permease [Rubrivivax sp. JA1024]EGJ12359.1 L-lactate permease [Rubrivivax benzoatilyticus JA2 = ATCC BAA-35]MCC9598325.1 L-lactate permease [Rubrivivax sp. JA1055]NHK99265.1 L-lactate permease [Rubrivivax benzoatilyticus]NHL24872.1 L-lactate permease [Rubrivivax benzoatilyticus]
MQPIWQQNYDPAGNVWVSALVALIPIIFFFLALTKLRLKGYQAGTITVGLALGVALLFYDMPVSAALASAVYGFFYGLWPIAWIIVAAVFLYKISVKTGHFDVIRSSILSVTPDQRLQLILVGFCFGAFLEGAAGFGAPVAITAALLVGLGFKPLYAAGLCLIANTAPVAFGAMGIPIIVAGQVSGVDAFAIGQMAGRQLPFMTMIVLFWLMAIMDGWRGVKETWPAVLVGGGSFAVVQFLTANYVGPELPDITSAIVSMVALTAFLKVWQPKRIFRFEQDDAAGQPAAAPKAAQTLSLGKVMMAWSPFIILTAMVTVWSVKPFKALFAAGGPLASTVISLPVPLLDKLVEKMPPVVTAATPYGAVYNFNWLSATGTAILLAALLTILFSRLSPAKAAATLGETLKELATPIYSIGMVLAFAFIANYSGLSATLALALAHTGSAFTFFSPFLGWIGVFLTGSDTSANALFAALQATTAQQLGLPEVLTVAANTTGGVTGKMISPQSIAIACAAVGLAGRESDLFRFTVKHSLVFAAIIGAMTTVQAYLLPWMIPGH